MGRKIIASGALAAALCALVVSERAIYAQRLLVCTTTLSSTREAVAVYLQMVDMTAGEPLPGVEPLPGTMPSSPMLLDETMSGGVLSSGFGEAGGQTRYTPALDFFTAFHAPPLQTASLPMVRETASWRRFAGCMLDSPLTDQPLAAALAGGVDEDGLWRGRLDVLRPWTGPEPGLVDLDIGWDLPGAPVAAAPLGNGARVAVFCRDALGAGSLVHVMNPLTGDSELQALPLSDGSGTQLGMDPSGLAVTADGRHVCVLTSGFALDRPTGDPISLLHVFDAKQFLPVSEPFELPGLAEIDHKPLQPTPDNACWVATQSPASGFAYATRIRIADDGVAAEAQVPFSGVAGPLRIVPGGSEAVALAAGNRLEIWIENRPTGLQAEYEAAIGALVWPPEGLFVGEGSRVHRVNALTGEPAATVPLQSGLVTDLAVIPAEAYPDNDADGDGLADTDGDGIADGVDPEPLTPSPRLRLPAAIAFHAAAAGREVRAFRINPPHGDGARWSLDVDADEIPWLIADPREGFCPDVVYMAIDPARHSPSLGLTGGRVTVNVAGTAPGKVAFGSPATIELQILPEPRAVRRILWIHDRGAGNPALSGPVAPESLSGLADLLAAPPPYFSQEQAAPPVSQSLDRYTVIVLDARSAARGALTRQALLDYVAGGGALLFLGAYLPDAASGNLGPWLSPLGITIHTNKRVNGSFDAEQREGLAQHWEGFRIEEGCDIRVDNPSFIVVGRNEPPNAAVLAARRYGYGRLVVLAGGAPLSTQAMADKAHRAFALDLFDWLARAAKEFEDMDGDGLPDWTEDRNDNGLHDPGETDYLSPDTDGDGIPDGFEDRNRNGRVDENETSPLNPDSDGDGVWDGADLSPLPPVEAPHVAALEPSKGPAEGGVQVMVSGRNFAPDAVVWFGERKAGRVRVLDASSVLVETPPCDKPGGGKAVVRVANPATGLEGTLPGGFAYGPRSEASLRLVMARVRETDEGSWEGALSLELNAAPGVLTGWGRIFIQAEPGDGFEWTAVEPGANLERAGRFLTHRQIRPGLLYLGISRGRHSLDSGHLATLHWRMQEGSAAGEPLTVEIERPWITARNGQPLDVRVDAPKVLRGQRRPAGPPSG